LCESRKVPINEEKEIKKNKIKLKKEGIEKRHKKKQIKYAIYNFR
jgi:hypothetical protein